MPVERRGPAVRISSTNTGGRGGMIKTPINLQDLRRKIYTKAITLGAKRTGERSAGKPPAPFEVAGAGNGRTVGLVRHSQRKRGVTDRPDLRPTAPVLDPTLGGGGPATRPRQSCKRPPSGPSTKGWGGTL